MFNSDFHRNSEEKKLELMDAEYEFSSGGAKEEKLRQESILKRIAVHAKLIYTQAQLEDAKKKMVESGEAQHTLLELPKAFLDSYRRRKFQLYCINLPCMIGIPMIIEFGDLATKYPEKAELVIGLLSSADLLMFVQSWMTYAFMRKMVTNISYNNETDKLTFH